jgi:hypothetical protein
MYQQVSLSRSFVEKHDATSRQNCIALHTCVVAITNHNIHVYESVVTSHEPMLSEADVGTETGIFQRVPIKGTESMCNG